MGQNNTLYCTAGWKYPVAYLERADTIAADESMARSYNTINRKPCLVVFSLNAYISFLSSRIKSSVINNAAFTRKWSLKSDPRSVTILTINQHGPNSLSIQMELRRLAIVLPFTLPICQSHLSLCGCESSEFDFIALITTRQNQDFETFYGIFIFRRDLSVMVHLWSQSTV